MVSEFSPHNAASAELKPETLPRKPLMRGVWWSAIALLAFLLVEAAVFRSGWYTRYLQPVSSAGMVENHLYWLRHAPPAKQGEVVVIGDSRIAEGFTVPAAGAATGNRLKFWNFGIGGMSPRVWYYLLRDADPGRRRFRAIVLPLDRYSDSDPSLSQRDHIIDLNYSIGRLRLSDCWDFAMSMESSANQRTALIGCIFKGVVLRADLHEFLEDSAARLKICLYEREHGMGDIDNYSGIAKNLTGLSADLDRGVIYFPQGVNESQMNSIRQTLTPDLKPDNGETTSYRRQWLGGILDLYKNSPTRIIFLQLPRAPLPVQDKVPPRFIQSVASRQGVSVISPERYRDLERPELFGDGLHLNADGRKIFTARLAGDIEAILGSR